MLDYEDEEVQAVLERGLGCLNVAITIGDTSLGLPMSPEEVAVSEVGMLNGNGAVGEGGVGELVLVADVELVLGVEPLAVCCPVGGRNESSNFGGASG